MWLPEPQVIKSITGRATSDRPIGWKDADALKFRPMALALSRFLRNVNSTPPLTLAVTGRWGTGKSSLMGLLKEDLEQRGTRTVWFNAWHHRQEEHLFAALMEAIRTQAVPPLWHFGGLSFRGRLLWQRTTRMRAVLLAVLLFGGIVLGTVYLGLGERRDLYLDRGFEWVAASFSDVLRENEPATGSGTEAPDADSAADRQSVSTLDRLSEIPVVGSVLALFGALLTWMIRMKLIAFPANPAALMANVTNRMRLRSFRDRLDFRYEFGLALSEVASALRTPTKAGLVIFIDDLDRCQPEDTLKILESVNFIVSSGPCIVILGMDRHQVEHTAGLGFKEIIEGLSNQELVFASGEEVSEPARRKAFARLYLEKLINVEVPVPSMNESAARALLGVGDPDPHDQSQNVPAPWVGSVKRRLRVAFALAPIVLVPVFIGALTVPLVERVSTAGSPVLAPLPEAGASRGPASGLEGEVSGRPAPTAEPEQPEQFVPYPVRASPPQSGPDELPMPTGWLLWVATFLVVVVAVLWGLDAIMRRRQAIHRDSPDFMKALVAVEPVLRAHYETPRAIKRWQNRMRLAAEFLRPEGHDIDIIDRGMGWLGNRLGKNWIPQVWFETGLKPKTSEPALILMGAREAVDPATFSDTPEEIVERLRGTPSPSGTRSKDDSPAAKAWGDVIRTYRDFPEEPSAWPDVDDVRRYAVLMRSVDGRRESIRRSDAKDPNSRNGARRTTDRLRKHVQD